MTAALLPDVVRARCHADPDRVALVCSADAVTYGQLESRVAELAGALAARGVGPAAPVGVCLDRGLWSVVAMLAIWRVGAVYVPLDPTLPLARLRSMTTQAQLRCAVANAGQRAVAERLDVEVVLTSDRAAPVRVGPPRDAADLAYVIFTSGSTGTPKATAIELGPLTAHVLAARDLFTLGPDDRVLAFASFSFDASLEQVLPSLTVGARVVVRPDEVWSMRQLATRIRDDGVTVMELTPAYWAELVAVLDRLAGHLGTLRLMVTGGEALPSQPLERWFGHLPHVPIVNTYGPTEAVISATAQLVTAPVPGRVPIGAPVADRRGYVLDDAGRQVPSGKPGELAIGGSCLARGYLGRPALTAERFTPDPYGDVAGGRLYRTGDQARVLPDGSVDFLGRSDSQVKLHGYRIELDEIASVLRSHPAVTGAHVAVRDTAGGRSLAAVVAASATDADELKAWCRSFLPEYMTPAAIAVLERLPVTSQGKVDAAACAALVGTAPRPRARHRLDADLSASPVSASTTRLHGGFDDAPTT